MSYQLIIENSLLGVFHLLVVSIRFVLFFITHQIVNQFPFFGRRTLLYNGPVGFLLLTVAEHIVRLNALLVFANTTSPLTGRSRRCVTPRNTLPGFAYFSLIYCFTVSDSGTSPVLSPCTISEAVLFTIIIWLSSYTTVIMP